MTRLTDRDRIDRAIPEAEVQRTVTEALMTYGYVFNHNADSRRSHAGLPDLVAVHRGTGQVLFIECKTEQGKLRAEQKTWQRAVQRGPAVHLVARPATLDTVVTQIARGARGPLQIGQHLVIQKHGDHDGPSCRVCGCTEDEACLGGCWWVADPAHEGDLCSRCLDGVIRQLGPGGDAA